MIKSAKVYEAFFELQTYVILEKIYIEKNKQVIWNKKEMNHYTE